MVLQQEVPPPHVMESLMPALAGVSDHRFTAALRPRHNVAAAKASPPAVAPVAAASLGWPCRRHRHAASGLLLPCRRQPRRCRSSHRLERRPRGHPCRRPPARSRSRHLPSLLQPPSPPPPPCYSWSRPLSQSRRVRFVWRKRRPRQNGDLENGPCRAAPALPAQRGGSESDHPPMSS